MIKRRALLAAAALLAVPTSPQPVHTRFTVRLDKALSSLDPAFRPSPARRQR